MNKRLFQAEVLGLLALADPANDYTNAKVSFEIPFSGVFVSGDKLSLLQNEDSAGLLVEGVTAKVIDPPDDECSVVTVIRRPFTADELKRLDEKLRPFPLRRRLTCADQYTFLYDGTCTAYIADALARIVEGVVAVYFA